MELGNHFCMVIYRNKTGHENEEVSVMQKNWGEQFSLMLALWKKLVFKNM